MEKLLSLSMIIKTESFSRMKETSMFCLTNKDKSNHKAFWRVIIHKFFLGAHATFTNERTSHSAGKYPYRKMINPWMITCGTCIYLSLMHRRATMSNGIWGGLVGPMMNGMLTLSLEK